MRHNRELRAVSKTTVKMFKTLSWVMFFKWLLMAVVFNLLGVFGALVTLRFAAFVCDVLGCAFAHDP